MADRIFCINIVEHPRRHEEMKALFHREGLCRSATFYRPARGRNSTHAIWVSHREVAVEARSRGFERILIFEDDVAFLGNWRDIARRTKRALRHIPADCRCFYLGHWAIEGYLVARDVMRASSSMCHAYIANRPLIDWLIATTPMDPYLAYRSKLIGRGIDGAFPLLPGMYALFPMAVVQKMSSEVRVDDHPGARKWSDPLRYRLTIIVRGMWISQWVAVILSPLHWLLMRRAAPKPPIPVEFQAEVARLFDEAWYFARYPDVRDSGRRGFEHFLAHGSAEGRNPNAWFDTNFYSKTYAVRRDRRPTPFEHYVAIGRKRGHAPSA